MGGDNTSFSTEKSGVLPRTLEYAFERLEKDLFVS